MVEIRKIFRLSMNEIQDNVLCIEQENKQNLAMLTSFDPSDDESWGKVLSAFSRVSDLKEDGETIEFTCIIMLEEEFKESEYGFFDTKDLKNFDEKTTIMLRFFNREDEKEKYVPILMAEDWPGFNKVTCIVLKDVSQVSVA